jgi:adenylyl-sulfate kinase
MKATNLHYHSETVTTEAKAARNGHNPCVIWLTGLSGSGKSTIANALESTLFGMGLQTHLLDGDNVRMGLNSDLGFSPEDRAENIRRIGEVANLFAQAGTIVITAFISPYESDRSIARSASKQDFLEVHVHADLETCESRDPKGLYKKARAGVIKGFTGIDAPYEAPDLERENTTVVDTSVLTVQECVDLIIKELREMKVIGA